MQTRVLWKGKDHFSLEHCHIMLYESGPVVQGVILGTAEGKIYKTEYLIKGNEKWHTVSLDLSCHFDDVLLEHKLRGDGLGNWTLDDEPADLLKGCLDLDISQTPFTNSLFINRANLAIGSTQEIRLIYFDVLSRAVKTSQQEYTRLSRHKYRFANIPNDFEAVISVDDSGIVIDYEDLFTRVAIEQ